MKIKIFTIVIFAFILLTGIAVKAQTYHPLHIGDTVPDVELKMLDYKSKTVHLSDFRGKLLILDFWSDWCTVCIAQFPRFDSLQKQFGDKICILPVGFDIQPGNIMRFRNSRKGTKREMKMATAVQSVSDSAMMQLFPHQGLPHEIWINEKGVLISVTDQLAVTAETITASLQGAVANLPQKIYNAGFNVQNPLFVGGNGGTDTDFAFRSIIFPYRNDLPSKIITASNEKFIRLACLNFPVVQMIKTAAIQLNPEYRFDVDLLNKRVLINVIDSVKRHLLDDFFSTDFLAMETFKHTSFYTYELILPPGYSMKNAYSLMLNELETYFKVRVRIEDKEMNCLALVRTSTKDKLHTDNKTGNCDELEDGLEYDCQFGKLDDFITYLNNNFNMPYVVNATGYEENIQIHTSVANLADMVGLRKELNRYDLDLIEKKANVDMLIIEDCELK